MWSSPCCCSTVCVPVGCRLVERSPRRGGPSSRTSFDEIGIFVPVGRMWISPPFPFPCALGPGEGAESPMTGGDPGHPDVELAAGPRRARGHVLQAGRQATDPAEGRRPPASSSPSIARAARATPCRAAESAGQVGCTRRVRSNLVRPRRRWPAHCSPRTQRHRRVYREVGLPAVEVGGLVDPQLPFEPQSRDGRTDGLHRGSRPRLARCRHGRRCLCPVCRHRGAGPMPRSVRRELLRAVPRTRLARRARPAGWGW